MRCSFTSLVRLHVRWFLLSGALFLGILLLSRSLVSAQSILPLPELGSGFYQGEQGGLYPDGLNVPPAAYLAELEAMAAQLAEDDELVVACLGMSMMQNACSGFINNGYASGPDINPALRVINAAIGSKQQNWELVDNRVWEDSKIRLALAGFAPEEVDIVLYHNAWGGPTLPFPDHSLLLLDSLRVTMDNIVYHYPNTQIIYLNSRHYGGWNLDSKSPEPWAYEEGFSYKWLIEERINGEIETPLLAWQAYQWVPTWPESYFIEDGLHLSSEGQAASAAVWAEYFRTTSYIAPWYLDSFIPGETPTPTATTTAVPTETATPTATASPQPTATPIPPSATPLPTATPVDSGSSPDHFVYVPMVTRP